MNWPLRFLVLSPTPTWPLDHGNRKRVHQVCAALMARGHEVHFLYYPSEHDWSQRLPRSALAQMLRQWSSVHVLPVTRPLHAPPAGAHHQLDEWWDDSIGDHLRWLFSVERFDALIVNYVWLSKAFEFCPHGMVKILDTHDRFGDRKEVLARQGLSPEFFYLTPDDEWRGLDRAELVLAIKEQEAALFSAHRSAAGEVLTLPYAEATRGVQAKVKARTGVVFGVLGARNALNRDSTARLLAALAERGWPDRMTVLIGGGLGADFEQAGENGVEVLGRVDDISQFYAACDAVVVPLDASTGQKVRIGEALAFGVPILAHEHAFEGYRAAHPLHGAKSIGALADAMIEVAHRPERLTNLAEASATSQAAQEAMVDAALNAIEARVRASIVVSVVEADPDVVARSPLAGLRFRAALQVAARLGRVVARWSHSPGADQRTPSFVFRDLPPECLFEGQDGPWFQHVFSTSLEQCLADAGASILWSGAGLRPPGYLGRVIVDAVLGGAAGECPSPDDSALQVMDDVSSSIDHGGEAASRKSGRCLPAPLLLGEGGLLTWSQPGGWVVWLVAPRWTELLAVAAERLSQLAGCTLWIWLEASAPDCPVEPFVLRADRLASSWPLPKQVFLFEPRSFVSSLAQEVIARSGAPCVLVDDLNGDRTRRSADQVCDGPELLGLVDLISEYFRARLAPPALGAKLPVESLDWNFLIFQLPD